MCPTTSPAASSFRGNVQIATQVVDKTFRIIARDRAGAGWTTTRVLFTAPPGSVVFASSISPDGRRLFVETNVRTPPIADGEDTDVWMLERTGKGWGPARPLGDPWATRANEHAIATSADETVCLNSARPGGMGENDIYCSRSFDEAPTLASTISSPAEDAFAALSAAGDVMVFASNRPGGLGKWDLYVARRERGGWSAPVNLGAPINSPVDELHPWIDGAALCFVRTGGPERLLLSHPHWNTRDASR